MHIRSSRDGDPDVDKSQLKRQSAMNREYLGKVLKKQYSVGLIGIAALSVGIRLFQQILDPDSTGKKREEALDDVVEFVEEVLEEEDEEEEEEVVTFVEEQDRQDAIPFESMERAEKEVEEAPKLEDQEDQSKDLFTEFLKEDVLTEFAKRESTEKEDFVEEKRPVVDETAEPFFPEYQKEDLIKALDEEVEVNDVEQAIVDPGVTEDQALDDMNEMEVLDTLEPSLEDGLGVDSERTAAFSGKYSEEPPIEAQDEAERPESVDEVPKKDIEESTDIESVPDFFGIYSKEAVLEELGEAEDPVPPESAPEATGEINIEETPDFFGTYSKEAVLEELGEAEDPVPPESAPEVTGEINIEETPDFFGTYSKEAVLEELGEAEDPVPPESAPEATGEINIEETPDFFGTYSKEAQMEALGEATEKPVSGWRIPEEEMERNAFEETPDFFGTYSKEALLEALEESAKDVVESTELVELVDAKTDDLARESEEVIPIQEMDSNDDEGGLENTSDALPVYPEEANLDAEPKEEIIDVDITAQKKTEEEKLDDIISSPLSISDDAPLETPLEEEESMTEEADRTREENVVDRSPLLPSFSEEALPEQLGDVEDYPREQQEKRPYEIDEDASPFFPPFSKEALLEELGQPEEIVVEPELGEPILAEDTKETELEGGLIENETEVGEDAVSKDVDAEDLPIPVVQEPEQSEEESEESKVVIEKAFEDTGTEFTIENEAEEDEESLMMAEEDQLIQEEEQDGAEIQEIVMEDDESINVEEVPEEEPVVMEEVPEEEPVVMEEVPEEEPVVMEEVPEEEPVVMEEVPEEVEEQIQQDDVAIEEEVMAAAEENLDSSLSTSSVSSVTPVESASTDVSYDIGKGVDPEQKEVPEFFTEFSKEDVMREFTSDSKPYIEAEPYFINYDVPDFFQGRSHDSMLQELEAMQDDIPTEDAEDAEPKETATPLEEETTEIISETPALPNLMGSMAFVETDEEPSEPNSTEDSPVLEEDAEPIDEQTTEEKLTESETFSPIKTVEQSVEAQDIDEEVPLQEIQETEEEEDVSLVSEEEPPIETDPDSSIQSAPEVGTDEIREGEPAPVREGEKAVDDVYPFENLEDEPPVVASTDGLEGEVVEDTSDVEPVEDANTVFEENVPSDDEEIAPIGRIDETGSSQEISERVPVIRDTRDFNPSLIPTASTGASQPVVPDMTETAEMLKKLNGRSKEENKKGRFAVWATWIVVAFVAGRLFMGLLRGGVGKETSLVHSDIAQQSTAMSHSVYDTHEAVTDDENEDDMCGCDEVKCDACIEAEDEEAFPGSDDENDPTSE